MLIRGRFFIFTGYSDHQKVIAQILFRLFYTYCFQAVLDLQNHVILYYYCVISGIRTLYAKSFSEAEHT